jgi:hypothetical protein
MIDCGSRNDKVAAARTGTVERKKTELQSTAEQRLSTQHAKRLLSIIFSSLQSKEQVARNDNYGRHPAAQSIFFHASCNSVVSRCNSATWDCNLRFSAWRKASRLTG